jgi:hypothetical protein
MRARGAAGYFSIVELADRMTGSDRNLLSLSRLLICGMYQPAGNRFIPHQHFAFSAPVAQLDRVPGYEPGGREFESLRARQIIQIVSCTPIALSDIPARYSVAQRVGMSVKPYIALSAIVNVCAGSSRREHSLDGAVKRLCRIPHCVWL